MIAGNELEARKAEKARGKHIEDLAASLIPPALSEELLLSYEPKAQRHIVSFAGHGILRPGNISTIVGPSGFGKSSVTEGIVSSTLNPYADCLGIKVEPIERPVLWIDGERTLDDIAIGFQRIKRRIQIEDNPELIDGDRFKNVHCYPFIRLAKRNDRVTEFERLCRDIRPGLVILDGAADFVRDVNATEECVDFIAKLVALANELFFGAMVSIHPNPGTQNDHKPRGVLGSELIRTSESMLLLKRAPDDREVRILTMDFAHGKNRNQSDSMEHTFKWDNTQKMFLSCNYTAKGRPDKAEQKLQVFSDILAGKRISYTDLFQSIVNQTHCAEVTAKKWVKNAIDTGMIFKGEDGLYSLTPF